MLNLYSYYDKPKELPLYDELYDVIWALVELSNLDDTYEDLEEFDDEEFKEFAKETYAPVMYIIVRNAKLSAMYAIYEIKGRFPEGEPAIMKSPEYASRYAMEALHKRWPEAEPIIKTDEGDWKRYISYFEQKNSGFHF